MIALDGLQKALVAVLVAGFDHLRADNNGAFAQLHNARHPPKVSAQTVVVGTVDADILRGGAFSLRQSLSGRQPERDDILRAQDLRRTSHSSADAPSTPRSNRAAAHSSVRLATSQKDDGGGETKVIA